MRRALVVGIDYYEDIANLHGCVTDAHSVKAVLDRHADGTANFGVKLLTGTGPSEPVSTQELNEAIRELFAGNDAEIALLYYAGHGFRGDTGGYLLGSECKTGMDGLQLRDVLTLANKSQNKNRIVVLDSCYSGIAASHPLIPQLAEIYEGVTVLTASTKEQYAQEDGGGGVFTRLFVDAFGGAAANLVGEITPGSVYAHVDKSLGEWDQRPVFKTNVHNFVSLRTVQSPIPIGDLLRITEFFDQPGDEYGLDPTYEPEMRGRDDGLPNPVQENTEKFAILQQYNRLGLLVPVGAPHMWHAAMESKSCKLTVLGEHYLKLVKSGRI